MTKPKPKPQEQDLRHPDLYFNRELSWLEFNHRVLSEALDERTRLLERLKFLAIFSNNLDEFFMVRVAGLKRQVEVQVSKRTPDGRTPQDQLNAISDRLRPMVREQHRHFEQELRPTLKDYGIHLLDYGQLTPEQQSCLNDYFKEQIFPVLTPLAVDPGHPFPYISNLSLNLAVVVEDLEAGIEHFARVKVPKVLPRFLPLPKNLWGSDDASILWMGVPLEQVIAHNLDFLFPGMTIREYHPFRITRNADLELAEDEADDLMMAIEQELRKRRLGGSVVRMEVSSTMPDWVEETLLQEMNLTHNDVYIVDGLLGLEDLMTFMSLPLPDLKDEPWTPTVPKRLKRLRDPNDDAALSDLEDGEDIFSIMRRHEILLHHPYHGFSTTVQQFIGQAARDPDVLAIKMTLYRTSGDSPIITALIAAAENGKQVVVLVELKARFDEENNIWWARKLEKSGVHVVYGLMGLKTHTKVLLVVRREDGHINRYVHIGTGNYNPKTAKLYTDLGLLSSDEDLGADLTDLFNFLTGYSRQKSYRKLLVAPVNLRDRMLELIQREIAHCEQGGTGRIIAKMNSLVDPVIIQTLYKASQAGVSIDLIVRGICCLRPQLPGISENIRVMSIIGRYLEHSRLFYFHNEGEGEIFIGSADWMPRNLDRRVEAMTPITHPRLMKDLLEVLDIMLTDNRQAWELQPDGQYIQRRPDADEEERSSQVLLMERALKASTPL
ncbi:MAG: polyphosphate kinase 1 [Elainellaceae cyanobacterium]